MKRKRQKGRIVLQKGAVCLLAAGLAAGNVTAAQPVTEDSFVIGGEEPDTQEPAADTGPAQAVQDTGQTEALPPAGQKSSEPDVGKAPPAAARKKANSNTSLESDRSEQSDTVSENSIVISENSSIISEKTFHIPKIEQGDDAEAQKPADEPEISPDDGIAPETDESDEACETDNAGMSDLFDKFLLLVGGALSGVGIYRLSKNTSKNNISRRTEK